jgi:hypothetical protein
MWILRGLLEGRYGTVGWLESLGVEWGLSLVMGWKWRMAGEAGKKWRWRWRVHHMDVEEKYEGSAMK